MLGAVRCSGSVRSNNQANACVFPSQRSLNAGIRTAGAGSTAGTAAAPSTWCVPAPRGTACTRTERDACKQVKRGQLGVTSGKNRFAGTFFSSSLVAEELHTL